MAESALLESGMKRRQRRERVDKVAAAIILQDYLDNIDDL
jgi:RNase H-fold protein (predicted Holliday junction resolvase)